MLERNFIITLLFISLSFSAFLVGYFITNQGLNTKTVKSQILNGFTPIPTPILQNSIDISQELKFPKARVVKKGGVYSVLVEEKEIFKTRLKDPILEWKDKDTLYLKAIKGGETVTLLLTLDGQIVKTR